MIVDTRDNFAIYLPVHPCFTLVSGFLAAHDITEMECGKIALGRGVTLSIDEYQTRRAEEKLAEFHEKFIDIQMVCSGIERAGYAPRVATEVVEPYRSEKDVGFSSGNLDYVVLTPANFIVFFPHDVHKPGVCVDTPAAVKKAVFKIPVVVR